MKSPPTIFGLVVFLASATAVRAEITSSTSRIDLADSFAGWQLVVADKDRDVTREATYTSDNPAVARVDVLGYVSAVGNGTATVRVQHAAGRLEIPVKVSGAGAAGRAVDFRTEVVPLLSKLGC